MSRFDLCHGLGQNALQKPSARPRGVSLRCLLCSAALAAGVMPARAQNVFSLPGGQTSLQLVTIGDVGNSPDTRFGGSFGGVNYAYSIGKYDVTVAQYTAFLNAVARSDPYGAYSVQMGGWPFACGITQNGTSGNYTYSYTPGAANLPVNYVSWADAARFCNWLSNGQPQSGIENAASTENGSYSLLGATTDAALFAVSRNASATYVVPTLDEWYKAGYYKGGGLNAGYWTYTTASDAPPSNTLSSTGGNNANYWATGYTDPTNYLTPVGAFAGSPSANGTYDQGGDVAQWTDTQGYDPSTATTYQILSGGDFRDPIDYLSAANVPPAADFPSSASDPAYGFRIGEVSPVPEPGCWTLLAGGLIVGAAAWRRSRRKPCAADDEGPDEENP